MERGEQSRGAIIGSLMAAVAAVAVLEIRASCAISADTSQIINAGFASSNQPTMVAIARRIDGHPSGAQCRVGGVGR